MVGVTIPQMDAPSAPQSRSGLDEESQAWLDALRSDGNEREEATARLYEVLLRASRFEVSRRKGAMPHLRGDDFDDLAHQAASDALMAILDKLDDFRGDSRFTTWAYKFALLEAAVKLRRRAWQGREVVLDEAAWKAFEDRRGPVHEELERGEALALLGRAIEERLSPHQRRVFIALALDEVPIDVLAERLETTRGALYKTLHDARRKLRTELAESGLVRPAHDPGNDDER